MTKAEEELRTTIRTINSRLGYLEEKQARLVYRFGVLEETVRRLKRKDGEE